MIKVIDCQTEKPTYGPRCIRKYSEEKFFVIVSDEPKILNYEYPNGFRIDINSINIYTADSKCENAIKNLIENGKNVIVCSDKFSRLKFWPDVLNLILEKEYTLLIDGNFVRKKPVRTMYYDDPRRMVREGMVTVGEDCSVTWVRRDLTPKEADEWGHIIFRARAGTLFYDRKKKVFTCDFPCSFFNYFKNTYIITNNFKTNGVRAYLNKKKVQYETIEVE